MPVQDTPFRVRRSSRGRTTWVFVLLIASLACAMPTIGQPTLTPTAQPGTPPPPVQPSPTPMPLPPAVIESQPGIGEEVPLEGPVTLYFNQAMDRASVEAALSVTGGSGSFAWADAATVSFTPANPLSPETALSLTLDDSARSQQGIALQEPVSLQFRTTGYLNLAQALPEPEAEEVNPTSAVVAAFNRPVVALGADPDGLPAAFSLEPAAQGRGEWINTSTYIFYPEPALQGGVEYTVTVDDNLQGLGGSPLEMAESWSFTTTLPRLISLSPLSGSQSVRLDEEFVLTFNQPMDRASVEANFSLVGVQLGPVDGEFSWNDDSTILTFTPSSLLARETTYALTLNTQALGMGGTPIQAPMIASLQTVRPLSVISTNPIENGFIDPSGSVVLSFSAPLDPDDILDHITISPTVDNLQEYWDEGERSLRLFANFDPNTAYTLSLSPTLADAWGGRLGAPFTLNFRTGSLSPGLLVTTGSDVLFLTAQDPSILVQATNIFNVPMEIGSVPLDDFIQMFSSYGYEFRQSYQPADRRQWQQSLSLEPDRSQAVELFVQPERQPLSPGIYMLRLNPPQQNIYGGPFLLVVSNVQVTFKVSATDTLVWAMDLSNNTPVANAPVLLYAEDGSPLVSGQTDAQGIFRSPIPTQENPYSTVYAQVGRPGQATFSLALSTWNQGVSPWDFEIQPDYTPPHTKAYIYTDRPIYRPGQTVYFRAVVRQAHNGRYSLPDLVSLPLTLGAMGEEIATFDLPLSPLGTGNGEFTLPANAVPGQYSLRSEEAPYSYLDFQVAQYRKPEINLQVSFNAGQALAGDSLTGEVNARYFFDAPAGNLPVRWALYAAQDYFSLPGYQVGAEDTRWLQSWFFPPFQDTLGILVAEGEAQTAPDGTLTLDLPTEPGEPAAGPQRQRYTLEVTAEDESGLPVSARAVAQVNPAEFYIGLRPDAWVGRAGEQAGFDVQVVDWEKQPAGERSLKAEFRKVVWVRRESSNIFIGPEYAPEYTFIADTDFTTNAQGQARLAFTPPQPGTYQLSVTGDGARSDIVLWVGGQGSAIWPALPNQRLRLTANKDAYRPGETAEVFVPNPFGSDVMALVTLERDEVLSYQVLSLNAGGNSLTFPLTADEAPNVYISVTLIGRDETGKPDFRQGYLNLVVEPTAQTLNVSLTSQPQRAGPGDDVTFEILVTDGSGNPVQGEFSLAVVDLAALALADPNSPDILTAFYSPQGLGVRTGLGLAVYTRRQTFQPPGMGGGGGDFIIETVVREDFPDTAYWNAEITTGPDGRAQVAVGLPDSLTTWHVDLRGLTADTLVGQAETQLVTTKDLLVRPVTPRFLVVNDHAQVSAVVHNNTSSTLQVDVNLQANGFTLDSPAASTQQVSVPAGGRAGVSWWGVAEDVESASLIFSARAGDLQDAARPARGALPVRRYLASQAFSTSGVLDAQDERLEMVSLPRSFDPSGGELDVELSPSLAAAVMESLDALEHSPYESTEQTLSRFLPNLEVYRAGQQFGVEATPLQARLNRTLNDGLQRLLARQRPDGGWSWWDGGESDPYVTAYVLFGLGRIKDAGVNVSADAVQRAVDYLTATMPAVQMLEGDGQPMETTQLDRLAFQQFALAQVGSGDSATGEALFQNRDRLNPWAKALLALTLEQFSPGSQQVRTLLSDLQASAIRSGAGVHWEVDRAGWPNMMTPVTNSAIVAYALAQRDPGSPLLADAVRYLMAHRNADRIWSSTYTTAWTIMALAEVMKGTGELGGDFAFSATLNGVPLASGRASGTEQLTPVSSSVPLSSLHPDAPNALTIRREAGQGRLYYTAALNVLRPVEDVAPIARGLHIERSYYLNGACPGESCTPLQSAAPGSLVTVRLALTLLDDAYYLLVEDFIPAGAEILDTNLKTSQLGEAEGPQAGLPFDPARPFENGWGWWYFHAAQVYDDHIAWAADYLPSGSYELTYTLVILQPGEYRVLPARAWQFYFPDVQANSAGEVFVIEP